jgi:hypothetical protein
MIEIKPEEKPPELTKKDYLYLRQTIKPMYEALLGIEEQIEDIHNSMKTGFDLAKGTAIWTRRANAKRVREEYNPRIEEKILEWNIQKEKIENCFTNLSTFVYLAEQEEIIQTDVLKNTLCYSDWPNLPLYKIAKQTVKSNLFKQYHEQFNSKPI